MLDGDAANMSLFPSVVPTTTTAALAHQHGSSSYAKDNTALPTVVASGQAADGDRSLHLLYQAMGLPLSDHGSPPYQENMVMMATPTHASLPSPLPPPPQVGWNEAADIQELTNFLGVAGDWLADGIQNETVSDMLANMAK